MDSKLINLIPKELWNTSGSVFYTGQSAWTGKRPVYILGLNPGGDNLERQKDQTLEHHTTKTNIAEKMNWSEYKDEIWEGKEAGSAPHQRRICHLMKVLGLDPHEVPASNVIFKRTRSASNLNKEFSYLANLCWPFHEYVIRNLGVKMVVCLGRSAGTFVKKKLDAHKCIENYTEQNNRKWKTSIFTNENGIKVVIATHPSRANWLNPESDPSPTIKRHFDSVNK